MSEIIKSNGPSPKTFNVRVKAKGLDELQELLDKAGRLAKEMDETLEAISNTNIGIVVEEYDE